MEASIDEPDAQQGHLRSELAPLLYELSTQIQYLRTHSYFICFVPASEAEDMSQKLLQRPEGLNGTRRAFWGTYAVKIISGKI
jgi:hypothetical protein